LQTYFTRKALFFHLNLAKVLDNKNIFWYVDPLNNFQGGGNYKEGLLQNLVAQGKGAIITFKMEKLIFSAIFH